MRHALIGVEGGYGAFGYHISTDLARMNASYSSYLSTTVHRNILREAYIHYKHGKEWCVAAGQMDLPVGMENATAEGNRMFMERSLPGQAARLGRRIALGAMAHMKDYDLNFAVAAFQGEDKTATVMTTNPYIPASEPTGYLARLTWSPSYKPGTIFHLGGTMVRGDLNRSYGRIQWKATPELRLRRSGDVASSNDVTYYSSGILRYVKSYSMSVIEAAGQYDSFTAQAEAFYMAAKRDGLFVADNISSKVNFHGAYGQIGYVLTGEKRPYDAKRGTFGRVTPRGKMGAFEVAIRQSVLDLSQAPDTASTDGDNPIGTGGVMHSTTFGLNYWHDEHFSAALNIVRPMIPVSTSGVNTDLTMYGFRVQMVF